MTKTYELFSLVRSAAKTLRTTNKQADGQKFWSPIKAKLAVLDTYEREWNPLLKTTQYSEFHDKVMALPEMIEHNHFIIQCVRIPRTEKLTVRKLIQVALNIGQLIPMFGDISTQLIQEFVDLNMISMKTYVPSQDVFDSVITDELIAQVRNLIN